MALNHRVRRLNLSLLYIPRRNVALGAKKLTLLIFYAVGLGALKLRALGLAQPLRQVPTGEQFTLIQKDLFCGTANAIAIARV